MCPLRLLSALQMYKVPNPTYWQCWTPHRPNINTSLLENVFVHVAKYICPSLKMYLFCLWDRFFRQTQPIAVSAGLSTIHLNINQHLILPCQCYLNYRSPCVTTKLLSLNFYDQKQIRLPFHTVGFDSTSYI